MPDISKGLLKGKLVNFFLLVTSLFGYLEWGENHHSFLFQAEAEVFSKLISDPLAVLHPLTVLPLIGQVILLCTLFQKTPGKTLTYVGIGTLGILLVFLFVVGMLSLNWKIMGSTIPFIGLSILAIRYHRKR